MTKKVKQKIASFLLIIQLYFSFFVPLSPLVSTALAKTSLEFSYSQQSNYLTVGQTHQEQAYAYYYIYNGQAQAGEGELTANAENSFYLGTESGDDQVEHSLSQLIFKTNNQAYYLQNNDGQLTLTKTESSDSLDLSTKEQEWLSWQVDQAAKSATTVSAVELDHQYKFPLNKKVSLTFTKLPQEPSALTIRQIELSPELAQKYGAEVAFDVTTNMNDGEFEFDLTLPSLEQQTEAEAEVEVVYAETEDDLAADKVTKVEKEEIEANQEEVKVKKLNHMTVFVVVNTPPTPNYVREIVDNGDIGYSQSGSWNTSSGACAVAAYDNDGVWSEPGDNGAKWEFQVPETGEYEVAVAWIKHANQASNASYTVTHKKGQDTFSIDQTGTNCAWSDFQPQGTYKFAKNKTYSIELDAGGADGHVYADAIRIFRTEAPDVVVVDDDWSSKSNGEEVANGRIIGWSAFDTISEAIDQVKEGGKIKVKKGSYPENLVVDKTVEIVGPNKNNDPAGRLDRGKEAIIDGGQIEVTAKDVLINGFKLDGNRIWLHGAPAAKIKNNILINSSMHGIYIDGGSNNSQIVSNRIDNPDWQGISNQGNSGILIDKNHLTGVTDQQPIESTNHAGTGIVINKNKIEDCANTKGVNYWGGAGVEIKDNIILGVSSDAIFSDTQATISGNQIRDSYKGIVLYGGGTGSLIEKNTIENSADIGIQIEGDAQSTKILENTVRDTSHWGIWLGGSIVSASIEDNTIENSGYTGITIWSTGLGDDFLVKENILANNSLFGLESKTTSGLVKASHNWWGDETGPQHSTLNPAGLGNAVSDNVDFCPWYKTDQKLDLMGQCLGEIQGRKYRDLNQNTWMDEGTEYPGLKDWEVTLYDSNWNEIESRLTGQDDSLYEPVDNDQYRFENLVSGDYYVCEESRSDYYQTGPALGDNPRNSSGVVVHTKATAVNNASPDRVNESPVCWKTTVSGDELVGYIKFGNVEAPEEPAQMQFGYETESGQAETGTFGTCDVYTNDDAYHGKALQILRFSEVPLADEYRITGYKWNGSSWSQTHQYDPADYAASHGNVDFYTEDGVEIYQTGATNEGEYTYFVEALRQGVVIGQTAPVDVSNHEAACSFTVDRSAPEIPINMGFNSHVESYSNRPVEIECGGYTNINKISHHWRNIDDAVEYQRQWVYPGGNPKNEADWHGSETWTTPYTNYRTFGGNPGTEGLWFVRVRARDEAGNWSKYSEPCQITYDTVAPSTPEWNTPADKVYTRQSKNIILDWLDSSDKTSGVAGYKYESYHVEGNRTWKSFDKCGLLTDSQIPNAQVGPGGSCVSAPAVTFSQDGEYQRKVLAVDKAGHESNWSEVYTLFKDSSKPTSSVNDSATADISNSLTFDLYYSAQDTGAGVKQVELFYKNRSDDDTWQSYGKFNSSPISVTVAQDGIYDFYTLAEDGADDLTAADMNDGSNGDDGVGNIEDKSPVVEATVKVDRTSLEITSISFNKDNPIYKQGDVLGVTLHIQNNGPISTYEAMDQLYAAMGLDRYTWQEHMAREELDLPLIEAGESGELTFNFTVPAPGSDPANPDYWTDDPAYTISSVLRMRNGYKDYDSNNGNYTFAIDNTAPVVDITSHQDGDIIGKDVTLEGEIVEDNLSHYNLSLYEDETASCNKEETWDFSQRIWQVDGSTNQVSHSLNTRNFEDGSYMIRLAARDLAGNRDPMANAGSGQSVEVVCVTIDNTKPVIEITEPSANSLHSQQVSLEGYAEDNLMLRRLKLGIGDAEGNNPEEWCEVINQVDGFASPATISCENVDISTYADGDYTAVLIAQDMPWNYRKTTLDFTIDNTPPTSTITSPNPGEYFNSVINVTGNTSDEHNVNSVTLSFANYDDEGEACSETYTEIITLNPASATSSYDWSYDWTPEVEGKYCLKAQGIDEVGNQEQTAIVENIIFDKTIPEVDLTIDPTNPDGDGSWYQTKPTITLEATDPSNSGLDSLQYQWDAQETDGWTTVAASGNLATTTTQPADEGSHVLYYRAVDLAGNQTDVDAASETGVKTVNWDGTELENTDLNVDVDPNPTSGTTATVTWDDAVDNIGVDRYEVEWDLQDGDDDHTSSVAGHENEYELTDLEEGIYDITVTAFDHAGHTRSDSTTLTVDREAPAAPVLTLEGTGDGTADLSWTEVDDADEYIILYGTESGDYIYAARVGDITAYTVEGLTAGSYFFVVRAEDSVGNQSPNSNEVSTGQVAGAAAIVGEGVGGPAAGFEEAGAVLGDQTDQEATDASALTEADQEGQVAGETISCQTPKYILPWLLLAAQLVLLLAVEIRLRRDDSILKYVLALGITLGSNILFYLLRDCQCYPSESLLALLCARYWLASISQTVLVRLVGYSFVEEAE